MTKTKPQRGTRLNITHPLATGLVFCQLFNEGIGTKTYDLSLNSNHGTLTNTPSWSDNGIKFDGDNDRYVDLGATPNLDLTGDLSIIAEIKPAGWGESSYGRIYSRIDTVGDPDTGWEFLVANVDPNFATLQFIPWGIDGAINADANSLSLNTKQTVAFTRTGTTGTFYVDGISAGSDTIATINSCPVPESNAVIGIRAPTTDREFNGIIYYLYIYNIGLTASAIQWLYREPYAMFKGE